MEAAYIDQNHWFIDGSFAVYDDMGDNLRTYMTFRRGKMNGSSGRRLE